MFRPASFTDEAFRALGRDIDGSAAVPGNQCLGGLADFIIWRLWRGHAVHMGEDDRGW